MAGMVAEHAGIEIGNGFKYHSCAGMLYSAWAVNVRKNRSREAMLYDKDMGAFDFLEDAGKYA